MLVGRCSLRCIGIVFPVINVRRNRTDTGNHLHSITKLDGQTAGTTHAGDKILLWITVDPRYFELGHAISKSTWFPLVYRYLISTRLFRNPTDSTFFEQSRGTLGDHVGSDDHILCFVLNAERETHPAKRARVHWLLSSLVIWRICLQELPSNRRIFFCMGPKQFRLATLWHH